MKPRYVIECWHHGWLICASDPEHNGIPMTALSECQRLFPRNAVMDGGIVHHMNIAHRRRAVVCVATPQNAAEWRREIETLNKTLPPEPRWWRGVDVGTSSATIFGVFAAGQIGAEAAAFGQQSVPRDADDFGRCSRLLAQFPEWRARLGEVARAFPGTKWSVIVARWDELEVASQTRKTEILSGI